MSDLTRAMQEYANAIRGDWSDFDGRSERDVIEAWIKEIESPSETTIDQWRANLGLCLVGCGHWCGPWSGHCEAKNGDSDEWDEERCDCPCTRPSDAAQ